MAIRSQLLFAHQKPHDRIPAPKLGILVTNHLNLMYMLSAGLVMPPSGFGSKYYQDTLGVFPGWIPLFVDKVFDAAVETSVREANHLRPCLAQINLANLTGPVWVLRGEDMVSIDFPVEVDGAEQVICVPAPLPTVWIESIIFRSPAELSACNADVRDYNNVPWTDFKRKSGKQLFAKTLKESWPPTSKIPERTTPLAVPLAAGGGMAMMLQTAHRGDLGIEICQIAFDPDVQDNATVTDPILSGLRSWLRNGRAQVDLSVSNIPTSLSGARELQGQLFWEIVDCLADWNLSPGGRSAEDVVLDYLEKQSGQLQETRLKQKVVELWNALESLTGLGAVGTTEMFERHPTSFSRSMTLLFLRRNCTQLLEFQHSLLTEVDWLAAALLFGVRSGWQELPLELRSASGLAQAVSHRMAAMSQKLAETGLDLGTPPPRCRPLRELFQSDWDKRHQRAARYLAQKQGWDCIQSTIHLNNGQYELRGSRGGIQILVNGEPTISYEVDAKRFFKNMTEARISGKEELEVRKILRT